MASAIATLAPRTETRPLKSIADISLSIMNGAGAGIRTEQPLPGQSPEAQDNAAGAEANNGASSNSDGGPARKRRRSRKGLDKRFECSAEGCGKSYSRAEHL